MNNMFNELTINVQLCTCTRVVMHARIQKVLSIGFQLSFAKESYIFVIFRGVRTPFPASGSTHVMFLDFL